MLDGHACLCPVAFSFLTIYAKELLVTKMLSYKEVTLLAIGTI